MKLKHSIVLLFVVFFTAISSASAQIVMKIMDPTQVNGESTLQGYANWTELSAFNGGSSSTVPVAGPGGGAGPAVTKCFTVSMREDRTTYYLKKEMYTGSFLTSVQIDFLKNTGQPNPQPYYRLLMERVYVTFIEEAADDGSSMVTLNVSFTPERFRYTYWPQLPNGTLGTPVVFGWDTTINQSW